MESLSSMCVERGAKGVGGACERRRAHTVGQRAKTKDESGAGPAYVGRV